MQAFFEGDNLLFTIPAVVGSAVFLIKLGLMTLGGVADIGDGDIDVDMDVDLDVDPDVDAVHADSTAAFTWLTVQSVAAFVMGFGTGGLAAKFGFEWPLATCIFVGIAFGLFMMWLISMGMKFVYDLQSSGNVDINNTVGLEGVVYTEIPEHGQGRGSVRLVVGQRMRIFAAVSDGEGIPSQHQVRVTRVNGDNSVTVAPA